MKGLIWLWGALQGNGEASICLYLLYLSVKCEYWDLESSWIDEVKIHNCLETVSAVSFICVLLFLMEMEWYGSKFLIIRPRKNKRKFDFCPGSDRDEVNFLHRSPYGAVVWICDQNSANTPVFWLLLSSTCTVSRSFLLVTLPTLKKIHWKSILFSSSFFPLCPLNN